MRSNIGGTNQSYASRSACGKRGDGQHIFGLFNRLNTQIPGNGIGLSLVKRIIEEHGGSVWVESEGEGTGSTFCFSLN